MDLENVQRFFRQALPERVLKSVSSLDQAVHALSPYWYLLVAALLAVACVLGRLRYLALKGKELRRAALVQKLSEARSTQDVIAGFASFFRELYPEIRAVGIYTKSADGFRLVGAGPEQADGGYQGELETPIRTVREYENRGRYHLYTLARPESGIAVRLVGSSRMPVHRLALELDYLAMLMQSLLEKYSTRSELLTSRIAVKAREIFSSHLFDREMYFSFLGHVISKASRYDKVEIVVAGKTIRIGDGDYGGACSRTLQVRDTDIAVKICRKSGITGDDVTSTGRFLDLISGMLAVYADKSIDNYLYFLEGAIKTHEGGSRHYLNHSQKMERLALAIGKRLGLPEDRQANLGLAARLHDVGMIGDIFELAARDLLFAEKEHGMLKYHPVIGAAIATPLDAAHPVSRIILQHHELHDGTGYPYGITSEEMLPESSILALSEIFIGLVSERPYRKGNSLQQAVEQLARMVPAKIDAGVYRAFLEEKDGLPELLGGLG